jgi:hypothetical protein
MNATEARKLTDLKNKLNVIYGHIRVAAEKGESTIKVHLINETRNQLRSDGYRLNDDIDCDNDYRGTWISW